MTNIKLQMPNEFQIPNDKFQNKKMNKINTLNDNNDLNDINDMNELNETKKSV